MVIGLLHDQTTYFTGFGYLTLYNLVLIVPLVAVLAVAADKALLDRVPAGKAPTSKASGCGRGLP